MQQTKEPNPTAATFASLLAALAAPAPKPEPEWEDEPDEELATLSYESALKTHARYKPLPNPVGMPPVAAAAPAPAPSYAPAAAAAPYAAPAPAPVRAPQPPLAQGKLKTASVTLRMSEEECEQLRCRAAEAGMTISAYLRSCTFEAETLRAQVKQAMAEMRAATLAATAAKSAPAPEELPAPRRSWRHMVERLIPNSTQLQHAARA
jgi:hypothetical protein